MEIQDLKIPEFIKNKYPHLDFTYVKLIHEDKRGGKIIEYKVRVDAHLGAQVMAHLKPSNKLLTDKLKECVQQIAKTLQNELEGKNARIEDKKNK